MPAAARLDAVGRHIAGTANSSPSRKGKGTIADVFVNLGASGDERHSRIVDLKKTLESADAATLDRAWGRLVASINTTLAKAAASGQSLVPTVAMADITRNGGRLPPKVAAAIRRAGIVVIKGAVPREEAVQWKRDLEGYIARNRHGVLGFPDDDPVVYELYWSKAQVAARQHPGTVAAVNAVNALWHAPAGDVDFGTPRMYVDRCRIRPPGDTGFALAPHVDNGSLERWEDPAYREIYRPILQGDWERFDPFDGTHRNAARTDIFNAANACSFFRTFQGWISLTDTAPGEGSLKVFPLLRESIAYYVLRPLLRDVPSDVLCGAFEGRSQEISKRWHPHLLDGMVSIPTVEPGDFVFWHCDTIHAVDAVHSGAGDSAVFFVPAAASCRLNDRYLARQWEHFVAGRTPPDFPSNDAEVGFPDRATVADLTPVGRSLLGGP